LKQTYHSVLNGFIEQLVGSLGLAQVLIAWGSVPLDPLVIVNFRFCLVIGIFNGTKIKLLCTHIWWCTSLVGLEVQNRHRALETFLFKYYCFYSNLLVYLYCNNLKLIKYGMSKTIINGITTISLNNNTIPMKKLLKLVNFKFIPR
jgi:hypothetical protein